MEYTSDYINSLSFAEYIKLMATELNENGFKENGQYEYCSFENDPAMQRLFMMGPINDPKAMAFLKRSVQDNLRQLWKFKKSWKRRWS